MDAKGIVWDDAAPGSGAGIVWDDEKPKRTATQELGRQAGLTARYGIEGLAGIPGIFINPFQQAAGGKTMTQATSDLLTRFGLPKEETEAEKLSGAISRGLAGGGGTARLASAIPAAVNAAPAAINNIFAQQPLAQTLQAGIGAGAGEATRQAGGGDVAQLLASAIAPTGVTGTSSIAQAAARGVNELRRPLTQTGAKQIAADVLGNLAVDKKGALQNIDQYLEMQQRGPVGVPGSKPTAGAVSADYGLIGGEQLASRGPANPDFAARFAANNEARLADLGRLNATAEQVAAYAAKREAITTPLREQALASTTPVNFSPVVDKITRVTVTPEGGRAESQKALTWLTQRVSTYLDDGRVDPRNAYELYKDIGELVKGKVQTDKGPLRLAGGLANEVKKALGEEIDKAAPGFSNYLEHYSRLSKPIERLEAITERLGGAGLSKVTNATPLVGPGGPSFGLSQAKMRQQVGNIEKDLPVGPRGLPLAPRQADVLGRVMGDLNSEVLAARGGKMPGSDTYQNIATANLLESVLGKTLSQAGASKLAGSPFSLAYRPLEARIRNIIDEAYLDPKKMAELLRMARTKRQGVGFNELLTTSGQNIYGGLLGGELGGQ